MYIKLKRQLLGSHGVQVFHIKLNIHPGTPQEWLHACHNSIRKVSCTTNLSALVGAYWLKRTKSNELLKRL